MITFPRALGQEEVADVGLEMGHSRPAWLHSKARGSKQGPAMFFSVHKSQSGQRWAHPWVRPILLIESFLLLQGCPLLPTKIPGPPPSEAPLSCVGSLRAGRGPGLRGYSSKDLDPNPKSQEKPVSTGRVLQPWSQHVLFMWSQHVLFMFPCRG